MSSPEMLASPLSSPSHEREKRWKETSLVFLRAEDEQIAPPTWSAEEVEKRVEVLVKAFTSLRTWLIHALDLEETPTYRARLDDVNFLLGALPKDQRLFSRVTSSQERTSQVERLSGRIPSGAISEILPLPRNPKWRLPGNERKHEAERMEKVLASHNRPFFISASDSHRSTGSVFRALAQSGVLDPKRPRAILSFDHHSDVNSRSTGGFGKENVMASILESDLAQALAVVGVQANFDLPASSIAPRTSFYEGGRFYTDGRPSFAKFQEACRELFEAWKAAGIVDIYPSVDLDGLRIDEMGYEGTDYAISRLRRTVISDLMGNLPPRVLASMEDSTEVINQALTPIEHAARVYRDLNEYHGIPAAWIAYALEEAQRQGFHIGVRDAIHNCTIVGDVTELHQTDPHERTTRIATALLDRMVRIAQEGEVKDHE